MLNLIETDYKTWQHHWAAVERAPLVQGWEYGQVKAATQGWQPQRFLFCTDAQEPVALVQVLYTGVPGLGGVARINRGPVLLHDRGNDRLLGDCMRALVRAARRRRWWYLLWQGDYDIPAGMLPMMGQLGFRCRPSDPTCSAVIDLFDHPERLRMGFHGKWRNLLRKAEKSGLIITASPAREELDWLVPHYKQMQKEKGFRGLSIRMIQALADQAGPRWQPMILLAELRGERVGAVLSLGHGDTCTYLIGWTNPRGREFAANYLLLWRAMLTFRLQGYRYFDVGGLGSKTTAGVAHFKRRLNGSEYQLLGEFTYSYVGNLLRPRKSLVCQQ